MRLICLVFCFLCSHSFASDIVLIDTGLSRAIISRRLTMHLPDFTQFMAHGQLMANSLNDELDRLETYATAEMVSCSSGYSNRECNSNLSIPILKAIIKRPKVISISISGDVDNEKEKYVIRLAEMFGILVVASSGNEGPGPTMYPAAYGGDCLLSVGTIKDGKKVKTSRDAEVYITKVGEEDGTSFSAVRVAGRAISYWKKNPELSCKDIKKWLMKK